MITTSSKFFYALAGFLVAVAVVYGYVTGGGEVGPLSAGYKGAVGELMGYTILMGGAAMAAFLGLSSSAFRDADPDEGASSGQEGAASTLPSANPPAPSYWPIVGAFGAALTIVGIVLNNVFFVAGLIVVGAVAFEWTMQTWAERATGDPAVNRELRNRIMLPLEVPLGGTAIVAVVILGYSRVFLTLSAENAVWAALAVAATVFGVGTLLSTRGELRKDLVAGVLAIGAVVTIGLGIFAAIEGEREFHHHETEDEERDEGSSTEEEGAIAVLEESN